MFILKLTITVYLSQFKNAFYLSRLNSTSRNLSKLLLYSDSNINKITIINYKVASIIIFPILQYTPQYLFSSPSNNNNKNKTFPDSLPLLYSQALLYFILNSFLETVKTFLNSTEYYKLKHLNTMTSAIQMSDEMLRQYVDGIFQRYDIDHSNTLTLNQLVVFFNDLLVSRGSTHKMSSQEVQQSLKAMDSNNDGQITKMELFNALKKMNSQSNILVQPTQDQNNLYPSFSTYTPIENNKIEQNKNYYNQPQTYNGGGGKQVEQQYQYTQPQITTTPQSYEAVPYGGTAGIDKKNAANYVKPKKQKAVSHGQGNAPMMATSPVMYTGVNPYGGMGYPMGPMGMGMGGMGMGMGPMGPMGPYGPRSYGMMGGMGYGMNPFMDLLGGLFGLGRFF